MTELAVAAVLLIFIFAKNEWTFGGIALSGAISSVLISIILLIRNMDNPFYYGKHTYADVDLSVLSKLETRWQNQAPTAEPKLEVSAAQIYKHLTQAALVFIIAWGLNDGAIRGFVSICNGWGAFRRWFSAYC